MFLLVKQYIVAHPLNPKTFSSIFIEKHPHVSGRVQFKPVLFKSQRHLGLGSAVNQGNGSKIRNLRKIQVYFTFKNFKGHQSWSVMKFHGSETQTPALLWLYPGLLSFPGSRLGPQDGCWSSRLYASIAASREEEAERIMELCPSACIPLVRA